jgi:hypothetical protein
MCFMAMGPMIGLMSSAVSAAGAQAQANAQANQAEYNAAVARINRDTARQQGVSQSETIASKYRRQAGQMTAAYGRAGVLPTSGSAALVLAENERNNWLDQHNAIWNRETEAIGFENKANDLEAQAAAARKGGAIAAAGSFLTGLGKFASGGSGGAGGPLIINTGTA